jgi:hypothetical protein
MARNAYAGKVKIIVISHIYTVLISVYFVSKDEVTQPPIAAAGQVVTEAYVSDRLAVS